MKKLFYKFPFLLTIFDIGVYISIIGGVVFSLDYFLPGHPPLFYVLLANISCPVLFLYYNLFRVDDNERLDYWDTFFDFGRYMSGIFMVFHMVIGISAKGTQFTPALWQLDDKKLALWTFFLEIMILLVWMMLYFISKRYKWIFPRAPKYLELIKKNEKKK